MKRISGFISGLLFLAAGCAASAAQSAPENPPQCQPAALDITLGFANQTDEHVVAVNYRNISESGCVLNGGIGAMFDNWHEGHNIWAKECRNCDAGGTTQPVAPLLLAPGDSAYFLLRWKKVADGPEPCEDSDGFNTDGIVLVAPSLLDHVCSVVDERSFLPGTFGVSRPDSAANSDQGQSVSVALTAPDSVLYAGDSFPFQAVVKDPKQQLALDDRSCPITFIRTRDATGNTMFHQAPGFLRCKTTVSSSEGRTTEVEMRAPGLGVLNAPGATDIQFYVLAGPAQAREVAMIASNHLAMQIVDPATLPPAWGLEVAGVAVSLVLDKQAYKTGEDVPLRMMLEDFGATGEIGSGELPCGAGLSVEVRDSDGAIVPVHGWGLLCSGHGWQTSYPVGKPIMVRQMTLSGFRMLPDRPGTYTVTATWHAMSFGVAVAGALGRPLEPYATVHSQPVVFQILPERY